MSNYVQPPMPVMYDEFGNPISTNVNVNVNVNVTNVNPAPNNYVEHQPSKVNEPNGTILEAARRSHERMVMEASPPESRYSPKEEARVQWIGTLFK